MKSNEYDIQIIGFKHNVKDFRELINKTNEISKDCTLQLLNADGIAGNEHILHATHHAIKAFERGENIAKDLGLEICLRTSAQRQISKALDILGINEGEMNICAVAVDCREDIINKLESLLDKRENNILESNENTLKEIYDISDEEIKSAGSVENVMIERTSLLILET